MPIFALVDCNNFYASCERVFNPRLDGKPIIVLSNNDGCVIARSNEAKTLGVPMGAPFYEWKKLADRGVLHAFSSNYALYGDMSHRVMVSLQHFCPDMEIYSIDEAFLWLDGMKTKNLVIYSQMIRKKIKEWVGLPVSIGIAPTKTLAKIANHYAKKKTLEGVFDLCDPRIQDRVLSECPVENIWGVGRRIAKRLRELRIQSARELRDANLKMIRTHFSVVVERIVEELRGISCIPLEFFQAKKQIMSSRSFGRLVTDLQELEESISHYTAIACVKLRKQNSLAGGLSIFLHTNHFIEKEPQYGNTINYSFSEPTNDSGLMIGVAKHCLRKIFRSGFRYQKAGILLMNLSSPTIRQYDLFSPRSNRSEKLMQVVDAINNEQGNNTVFFAAEGIERRWKARCHRMSKRYTTRWNELVEVVC